MQASRTDEALVVAVDHVRWARGAGVWLRPEEVGEALGQPPQPTWNAAIGQLAREYRRYCLWR